jgi:ferric-dicitrate binding protein FerR (iron transport regulator)
MSPLEKDIARLIDLLSRGWDGRLCESDNEQINAFLRQYGPAGAEMLLKASSIHLELGKHVASAELFERAMEGISESAEKMRAPTSKDLSVSRRKLVPSKKWQGWAAAAMAAALLLGIGSQFYDWRAEDAVVSARTARLLRPSRPVASLVSIHQATWAEGSAVQVGQTIDENKRLELVSGSAQLSMACGADIVLQAPCTVSLVADDFVRLESGKLTAQAAKWATGFVVAANDLKVTDLGTRFALSTGDDGVVEAHVLEGSVLAEPIKERRRQQSSMLLESGQAIRVDGIRSKVDLIATRRNDFIDELEQFRPLRPISIWNTGTGAKLGSEDPNWRITGGSEGFGPYPRPAIITDGDTRSYEDNRPDVSQWISVSKDGYPGVPPESTHTFETTFDLTGYDLDTVYIVGYFLVDDAINELRINGHPVDYKRWVTTWDVFDFRSFHPIEIVDHFVEGENVISIDIYNSPSRPEFTPDTPNPTALRVEWQAFGNLLAD